MDEGNNHFDFDFTPIGQAIKPHFIRKCFLTRQNNGALKITFHHNNNGFVTGKLFDLTFQRFKSCKFSRLFPSVTADKLIPSVLF